MSIKLKLIKHALRKGLLHEYSKLVDDIVTDIFERGELIETDKRSATFLLDGKEYSLWLSESWLAGCIYRVNNKLIEYEYWLRPSINNMERIYKEFYSDNIQKIKLAEQNRVINLLKRE
jgi:hypothetical protein